MQRQAQATSTPRPTHKWLPDAELDAHPFGTWLLQMGFDLWIRACYQRVVLLPDDFHIAPGTLIASNHQRDVDGPMLGTVLVRRRGLRFQWPLPFYATREDLFRPGILTHLTVHWPRPLSALLGHIPLAWFFALGRAEPMRRVREFTLGETLRALVDAGYGANACGALLNPRGLRELDARTTVPLQAALARAPSTALESWWGLRRLQAATIARIAPAFRATVDAQLAHFTTRLDRGRCVYFAPEGSISMDGHFARTRAGFFRLVHTARYTPWIQPMALGYDTLAPGRSRVVVRVGQPFRADRTLDRRRFDAMLRHAVLEQVSITPSHLLARFLLHHAFAFGQQELIAWMTRSRATLRARHATLDPLLAQADVSRLADQRLRWLERKCLIVRTGATFAVAFPRDAQPGWNTPANIARYLDHNLADLVPDIERILPC
jgi:1-acyl-sn-glycerol-3-phosphate acyltransferase